MGANVGPSRREPGVMWEEIGEELLVFDTERSRAHSLNAAAAAVWRACDGDRDLDALAFECELDPEAVALALERLGAARLLEDGDQPAVPPGVSRRAMLRRTLAAGAAAGAAIPVIRSMTAPTMAMAASHGRVKGKAGQHCTGNSQCSRAPKSFCNLAVHSCQRSLGASCSHDFSCDHESFFTSICRNGVCGQCSSNHQCPASFPTCSSGSRVCVK